MDGQDDVLVILIGNKCDLEAEREVSTREGELLAKVFILFLRSSASVSASVKTFLYVIFYWPIYNNYTVMVLVLFSYNLLMLIPCLSYRSGGLIPIRTDPVCARTLRWMSFLVVVDFVYHKVLKVCRCVGE